MIFIIFLVVFCSCLLGCNSADNVDWEKRYNLLYGSQLDTLQQRDEARAEVLRLEEANKEIQIKWLSCAMSYNNIKDEYKTAIRFIDVAEYIMTNLGVKFTYLGERDSEKL